MWGFLKSSLNGGIPNWQEPLSFCFSPSCYLGYGQVAEGGATILQPQGDKQDEFHMPKGLGETARGN